jgi:HAD superfamily phosphoserine phosphatase-like hydrolase
LSNLTGLNKGLLRKLERINKLVPGAESLAAFAECDLEMIKILEHKLECRAHLEATGDDDFLYMFTHYYDVYKGKSLKESSESAIPFNQGLYPTKAVIFDFDGTLTLREGDNTVWETIWSSLGYKVSECSEYLSQFKQGDISHEQWCQITCERFRKRGLTRTMLTDISRSVTLIPGVKETFKALFERKIKIYIVSGAILSVIRTALGHDIRQMVEEIAANELEFDHFGGLERIRGTKYDFEEKATFIDELMQENRFSAFEVLFVGNSFNDVYASQSGARTLCINPHYTDPFVKKHWTYSIRKLHNLTEILKFVNFGASTE